MIGHGDKHGQEEHVEVPVVVDHDVVERVERERVGLVGEERHNDREVVAVRLDEVVSSDRRRIDVVFAEISQKVLLLAFGFGFNNKLNKSMNREIDS